MRKGLGLLFAISLCVPIGVMTASSAGAANTVLPTCKGFSGTQTYVPGLPKLGVKTLVKPVTTTKLTISGCSGGGITSGTSSGSTKAKTGTNCNTLVKNSGKPGAPTTGIIKWSNGQTSTTSNVLTVLSKAGVTPIKAKLVTTYTAGLGKGKVSTALITATLNKGACLSAPLSKSTFHSTKITTK
jgi:hypothetical protein